MSTEEPSPVTVQAHTGCVAIPAFTAGTWDSRSATDQRFRGHLAVRSPVPTREQQLRLRDHGSTTRPHGERLGRNPWQLYLNNTYGTAFPGRPGHRLDSVSGRSPSSAGTTGNNLALDNDPGAGAEHHLLKFSGAVILDKVMLRLDHERPLDPDDRHGLPAAARRPPSSP